MTKTEIFKQIAKVYFSAVEKLSSFLNFPSNVKAAEVLFFIHNLNRFKRFPQKSYIQLHLYMKDISQSLRCLREYNLIELIDDKHYRCTETALFLEKQDDLFDYYISLHALDDFYDNKVQFNNLISFIHAIESLPGLDTPVSSRRTLVRCFCMCDKYTKTAFSNRVSNATACLYARDIRNHYSMIEYSIEHDTYDEHVKKEDKYNAVKYHQLSLLRQAQTFVNNNIDKVSEEIRDIAERAKSMKHSYTKETINIYLYTEIVTKKLSELELQRTQECVYWSEQPSLECIEINKEVSE